MAITTRSQSLCEGCYNGNQERVRQLLRIGTSVNTTDRNGFSPLLHAASNGQIEIVRLLIQAEASLNFAEKYSLWTPLMEACNNNHHNVARELLLARADPNMINKDGDTSLIRAAQHTNIDSVKLLLKAGADSSPMNKNKLTAHDEVGRFGAPSEQKIALVKNDLRQALPSSIRRERWLRYLQHRGCGKLEMRSIMSVIETFWCLRKQNLLDSDIGYMVATRIAIAQFIVKRPHPPFDYACFWCPTKRYENASQKRKQLMTDIPPKFRPR